MNTQKKKNTQKKEKPKGERTSVPRPLSWNIYAKKQCWHTNRAAYNYYKILKQINIYHFTIVSLFIF